MASDADRQRYGVLPSFGSGIRVPSIAEQREAWTNYALMLWEAVYRHFITEDEFQDALMIHRKLTDLIVYHIERDEIQEEE